MASSVRLPLSGHLVYFPVFPPPPPDAADAATDCTWGKLLDHLGDAVSMGAGVLFARHPSSKDHVAQESFSAHTPSPGTLSAVPSP